MFALADCNNFYASCERVFQPHLNGKPIIVLSNNDGCVIARSNEAKALGIKMGAPFFQIERFVRQKGIAVFSSNFALYGDMSRRVMEVLADFAPRVEVYSIDECFLDFSGMPRDLTAYSLDIAHSVRQWTGIPISIGIAPTKTLAKIANRLAKKGLSSSGPVLEWSKLSAPEVALSHVSVEDVWGISSRWGAKLRDCGIENAQSLRKIDSKQLRRYFGVVMERIACELQGISCIPLEDVPPPRKQILTSRSFGEKLTRFEDLRAAIAHFASRSAEKLRRQHLAAQALTVFIETSPFDTRHRYYANRATTTFALPSQDSAQLVQAARRCLERIFKPDVNYQRAGVLLPELMPVGIVNSSFFDSEKCSMASEQLMATLDNINYMYGRKTVFYGSELISNRWHMRQQYNSSSYTTNWNDLLTVHI